MIKYHTNRKWCPVSVLNIKKNQWNFIMTQSTVAFWPMAITSPSENEGNSDSDFMKQNSNINIDDSPTNDKPEWRYNQEPPNNISPSTTASSHSLYYHQSSPTLSLLSYIDSESRRDFSNPLIYLPSPKFSHKNPSKKVACHLMISNSHYPLPRCSCHLILNLYLRAC